MALSRVAVLLLGPGLVNAAPERRAPKSVNLNGRYSVSTGTKQDVHFNDDYASKGHEYFDMWAPEIATHYGEVFWTEQGDQPIPDHIRERFNGKVIAITGYEFDQVMVDPTGQPGVNPEKDISVPINWAYNHHYMFWLTGKHSELRRVAADAGDPMAHGAQHKTIAVDLPSAALRADPSIPTSQWFSEGNGGESRKSFHGYPNGFAQLVDSPTTFRMNPMQIDTRNRDCGVTRADINNCTQFVPGPEPRQARFGRPAPKGTNYSGILECPCNSRFGGDPMFYPDSKTKIVSHNYLAVSSGTCPGKVSIESAEQCFAAAAEMGFNVTRLVNKSTSDANLPEDCSITQQRDGSAIVNFNTGGKATCQSGMKRTGEATSRVNVTLSLSMDASNLFCRSKPGKYCSGKRDAVLKEFKMASSLYEHAFKARNDCEKYCLKDRRCWGCSVDCPNAPLLYGRLGKACQWTARSSCEKEEIWQGMIEGDVSKLKNDEDLDSAAVTITVSGPADRWFGVGLNASRMFDQPYALICNESGVLEQKLGTCGEEARHCPGTQLESSVKVVSNTVSNGRRTIVMSRGLHGLTPNHYSFDMEDSGTMHLITAIGHSQTFAYHQAHGPAEMSLSSTGFPTCICDAGQAAKLCESGGTSCSQFVKGCVAEPNGDLLEQRNPTCNSQTYVGGLSCCGHKRIMLDADQEIRPELLRYHMKIRFWFQEYTLAPSGKAASHANLERIYYQTEANAGEYDIPPAFARGQPIPGYAGWPEDKPTPGTTCTGTCPDGPDCDCVHTITHHWTMSETRLIYAGGHCHAPSCVSIDLYRNDTGTPQLLCHQATRFGQGNFPTDKFDEAGYIMLPPCLWSDDTSEGLEPTQWLPKNTPMFSVKKTQNTHWGHYGDMASWQMRGVHFEPPKLPDVLI
eukprot:CAMPEP_0197660388 /NCGR_PEP_ID=MMETSP1338-20131121/50813_1 /TAXON_ID=43686 ORGANISM="Pelagodinium beii, Strain RCC1491" /NCGR_SAMPLE_ID=MMETSP1338 /ASSEMBLY_ACC=CAM_ASM_000754 /LENGTH=908 /DNA_ID=CAMNT_0043237725 /DNA_START=30 /DNA_END=2756 /DNA_ORIENTATION=-